MLNTTPLCRKPCSFLEIVARPTEETVQTAKTLALHEPDAERRSLLVSLVALLAARYLDKEVIRRLFRQERRVLLLRLLGHRFGQAPIALVLKTQGLTAAQLDRLFDLALDVPTLDDFDRAMDQIRGINGAQGSEAVVG
ncbi:MAG: DUF4351 domain-containing protein [Chloroflexota bacterium]